jgi:hypothetical protein
MAARYWLTLVIALCGALAATGAEAAKKAKGPPPTASGCTFVQGLCLGLVTSRKATYSLWDGKPWIPPGIAIDVWGKATGPSPCGGTSIQVASWKPAKGIKCKR